MKNLASRHPWTTRYLLFLALVFLTILAAKGVIA